MELYENEVRVEAMAMQGSPQGTGVQPTPGADSESGSGNAEPNSEPTAQPTSKHNTHERVVLSWTAPEFIRHEKGKVWFLVAGLAVAALVVYGIYTSSWTVSVVFIVLAGVYYLAHHKEPRQIQVSITTLGIKIGSNGAKRIPFNQLKAFWIIYHPPMVSTLKLLTTEKMMNEITIQLGDQDPAHVRDLLRNEIPEYEGRGESFAEVVIRLLKL